MVTILYGKEQTTLDPMYISSFVIEASIFSHFIRANAVLKDFNGILFNNVKLGEEVTIQLQGSSQKRTYRMIVDGYEKISSSAGANIDTISVTLISAWARKQTVSTAAYRGPISSIATTLLANDPFFPHSSPPLIEAGDDQPSYRYRFNKTAAAFLSDIQKFATKKLSPMLFFMNINEQLVFKSFGSLVSERAIYTIQLETSGEERAARPLTEATIPALSLAFQGDAKAASSSRKYYFSTKNLQYTDMAMSEMTQTSLEKSHKVVTNPSPPSYTRVFDWATTPGDSIALATRDSLKQDLKLFTATAITTTLYNTPIDVGDVVYVRTAVERQLHDGLYLVASLQYDFSTSMELSRLTLCHVN